MSALTEQWQARIDADFPDGFTATWEQPGLGDGWGSGSPSYRVPWVWVTGQSGLDPVVTFWVHGVDKAFHGLRILSYTEIQRQPVLLVRLAFDNVERVMLWSGGIGAALAAEMAPFRARLQAYAAQQVADGLVQM